MTVSKITHGEMPVTEKKRMIHSSPRLQQGMQQSKNTQQEGGQGGTEQEVNKNSCHVTSTRTSYEHSSFITSNVDNKELLIYTNKSADKIPPPSQDDELIPYYSQQTLLTGNHQVIHEINKGSNGGDKEESHDNHLVLVPTFSDPTTLSNDDTSMSNFHTQHDESVQRSLNLNSSNSSSTGNKKRTQEQLVQSNLNQAKGTRPMSNTPSSPREIWDMVEKGDCNSAPSLLLGDHEPERKRQRNEDYGFVQELPRMTKTPGASFLTATTSAKSPKKDDSKQGKNSTEAKKVQSTTAANSSCPPPDESDGHSSSSKRFPVCFVENAAVPKPNQEGNLPSSPLDHQQYSQGYVVPQPVVAAHHQQAEDNMSSSYFESQQPSHQISQHNGATSSSSWQNKGGRKASLPSSHEYHRRQKSSSNGGGDGSTFFSNDYNNNVAKQYPRQENQPLSRNEQGPAHMNKSSMRTSGKMDQYPGTSNNESARSSDQYHHQQQHLSSYSDPYNFQPRQMTSLPSNKSIGPTSSNSTASTSAPAQFNSNANYFAPPHQTGPPGMPSNMNQCHSNYGGEYWNMDPSSHSGQGFYDHHTANVTKHSTGIQEDHTAENFDMAHQQGVPDHHAAISNNSSNEHQHYNQPPQQFPHPGTGMHFNYDRSSTGSSLPPSLPPPGTHYGERMDCGTVRNSPPFNVAPNNDVPVHEGMYPSSSSLAYPPPHQYEMSNRAATEVSAGGGHWSAACGQQHHDYMMTRHPDQQMESCMPAIASASTSDPARQGTFSDRQVVPLATGDDEKWLSEFLCYVRSECTEVFTASREDVAARMNSKKVLMGQVGIRCRFCSHLPHRERTGRSSSYPSSISRIYQSLTMMLRDHFTKCSAMPSQVQERYMTLKANASQGATDSKKYWVTSAKSLGLVDTEGSGIRFAVYGSNHVVPPSSYP